MTFAYHIRCIQDYKGIFQKGELYIGTHTKSRILKVYAKETWVSVRLPKACQLNEQFSTHFQMEKTFQGKEAESLLQSLPTPHST